MKRLSWSSLFHSGKHEAKSSPPSQKGKCFGNEMGFHTLMSFPSGCSLSRRSWGRNRCTTRAECLHSRIILTMILTTYLPPKNIHQRVPVSTIYQPCHRPHYIHHPKTSRNQYQPYTDHIATTHNLVTKMRMGGTVGAQGNHGNPAQPTTKAPVTPSDNQWRTTITHITKGERERGKKFCNDLPAIASAAPKLSQKSLHTRDRKCCLLTSIVLILLCP